jgi:hypothetical protein
MMNLAITRKAAFALPIYGRTAAFAGAKRRSVSVAPVCGHTATTDVFVLGGAFPGTSVWSPPI